MPATKLCFAALVDSTLVIANLTLDACSTSEVEFISAGPANTCQLTADPLQYDFFPVPQHSSASWPNEPSFDQMTVFMDISFFHDSTNSNWGSARGQTHFQMPAEEIQLQSARQ